MSLYFELYLKKECVYEHNLTHNLNTMAKVMGIYYPLWRPEEIGIKQAVYLIPILSEAIENMKKYQSFYEQFNPKNGWGDSRNLYEFISSLHSACLKYPQAKIKVSR